MKNLIYIIGFLLITQISWASSGKVHFRGTVSNDKNVALQGAFVQVNRNASLFNVLTANADGQYAFDLPIDGEYDVIISKPGYVTKRYVVSTIGVPEEKLDKLPLYVADVMLFNYYDGIDYSLFDEPMNKYRYNSVNNNMDYDEAYLKSMKEAMKEVKKAEKELLKTLHEKETADKKAVAQSKVGYIPQRKAVAAKTVANTNTQIVSQNNSEISSTTAAAKKKVTDARTLALLEAYKPGVTEEIIEGKNVYIIQRVIVKDQEAYVYQKKIFSWGGVACFRDKAPITEVDFEQETSKEYNQELTVK